METKMVIRIKGELSRNYKPGEPIEIAVDARQLSTADCETLNRLFPNVSNQADRLLMLEALFAAVLQ